MELYCYSLPSLQMAPSSHSMSPFPVIRPFNIPFCSGNSMLLGFSRIILLFTPSHHSKVVFSICPQRRPVFPSYHIPLVFVCSSEQTTNRKMNLHILYQMNTSIELKYTINNNFIKYYDAIHSWIEIGVNLC